GDAVGPCAQRPKQHEPENHRKQAIISLDAYSLLDFLAALRGVKRDIFLEQRFRRGADALRVIRPQGCAVLVHLLCNVPRTEREEKHDDGKNQVRKAKKRSEEHTSELQSR